MALRHRLGLLRFLKLERRLLRLHLWPRTVGHALLRVVLRRVLRQRIVRCRLRHGHGRLRGHHLVVGTHSLMCGVLRGVLRMGI